MTQTSPLRFEWVGQLARDARFTDDHRRTLLLLWTYADPDGRNARPGVKRLSEELAKNGTTTGHVSDRTVRTALALGIERGYLTLTGKAPRGRGVRLADVYSLTMPTPEKAVSQVTGSSEVEVSEKAATQTAGNQCGNTGKSSPKYRQSETEIPATQVADHQALNTNPSTPEERSAAVEVVQDAVVIEPSTPTGMDLVRSAMPRPGNPMQNALAKQADELLLGGTAPEVIESALRDWFSRPDARSAGLLPHLCSDVMKRAQPPVVPTGPVHGAASRKIAGWAGATASVLEHTRGPSDRDSSRPRIPPPRNADPLTGGLDAFARSLTRTPD